MKKVILVLALMLSASTVLVSCKGDKKEHNEESEMQEDRAANKADMAVNTVYQCPMDCEEGKTYESAGACPVCAMDLKKVEKEGEHEHENGETHEDHDEDESHEEDLDSKEDHDKDGD